MAEVEPHPGFTDEQMELHVEAIQGLMNGNLLPLVRFLRSDFPLEGPLREDLANAIEGNEVLYRLVTKKTRRGPGDSEAAAKRMRQIGAINLFVIAKAPFGSRGLVDAAVKEAADHFGVSRSTVMNARRELRRWAKDPQIIARMEADGRPPFTKLPE